MFTKCYHPLPFDNDLVQKVKQRSTSNCGEYPISSENWMCMSLVYGELGRQYLTFHHRKTTLLLPYPQTLLILLKLTWSTKY